MKCSIGISSQANSQEALLAVIAQALEGLQGVKADLAVVFSTPDHEPIFEHLGQIIKEHTDVEILVGCTAETVIGKDSELEDEAGLCLWLASLPQTNIEALHIDYNQSGFSRWQPISRTSAAMVLLVDPFTFPTDLFLKEAYNSMPGLKIIGGMSSGPVHTLGNYLFLNQTHYHSGALALLLEDTLEIKIVVSQGCRPVGNYFVITKAENNIIYQLGGKPALKKIEEMILHLVDAEQKLIQQGMYLGIAINAAQDSFSKGDFLIRNVIGIDEKTGALAVGEIVRAGQTVQFNVRDAESADEDLQQLLMQQFSKQPCDGALLFTCNGRGQRMFSKPHHDIQVVQKHMGNIPSIGFFAAGEVGPIGTKNFVHGFTAVVALFYSKSTGGK